MKKIYIIFFMIISIFMTGCSQNESFDVSKITPPESDNIKILGEWEVVSKLHDNSQNNIESTDGTFRFEKGEFINISKNELVVNGVSIIANPNFKLKRVERNVFFKEIDDLEIKKEIKDTIKSDYIDVTAIYDSNKTYLNMISINENEAYILLSDNLIKLKKVSSVPQASTKSSEKVVVDQGNTYSVKSISPEYYQKDVGILLGLKEPAHVEKDDFEKADYKTLWISVIDNELQPIMVLEDSLLLPRVNGFSNISLDSNFENGVMENKLEVTSRKKDPNDKKEVKGEQTKKGIYEEITFVGNDYIGLESYSGDDFKGSYNEYNIIPIDTMNTYKSMDIVNLFGKEQEENYNKSEEKAIQKYNIDGKEYYTKNKYSNITLQRKNGNWHLEGLLNEKKSFDNSEPFDININPVPILINYDTLAVPWSQVSSLGRDVRDVVTAPNGKIAITLAKDKLSIYKITDGRLGERLGEININSDEKIVMAEWAVGDYVKYWNETVENVYGAKKIT
ncbi:hypothetical protein [Clostridium sp. LIBA-8841]|uniref:hypothetical protein n=1 Tax=Clostridium sp. LIBA-8841 TaxID=2987530 RepID=UPI002AC497D4|nr:hypothetical protein [Clostridium sp. LIBA-8841]MDZ5253187.1 hypothetical protein [Clostridium sp. LIBA-8841]